MILLGCQAVRTVWLQVVDFESLGAIEPWARRRGHELFRVALWKGEKVPNVESFDCLMIMGGPMVPTDHYQYPWLPTVLEVLRSTVASGRPVLGICLGAQLLGHAHGGHIRGNDHPEFGWHLVRRSPLGQNHALMRGIPDSFTAFQWHCDTVSVPVGAVSLASSEACPNQVFAVGPRGLGVQFHPEITPEKARSFVEFTPDQGAGPYVQQNQAILSAKQHFREQQEILERLLTNLLG
jgi:GMP synthase-like glutamine amidotransferase